MNKENARLYIPLIQALSEGKAIQGLASMQNKRWEDYPFGHEFDFTSPPECYRVKPEPKSYWFNEGLDGVVDYYDSEEEAINYARLNAPRFKYIAKEFREVIKNA